MDYPATHLRFNSAALIITASGLPAHAATAFISAMYWSQNESLDTDFGLGIAFRGGGMMISTVSQNRS
jgi:hypothetical protein